MAGRTSPGAVLLVTAFATATNGLLGLERTPAFVAARRPAPSGIINVNSAIAASRLLVVCNCEFLQRGTPVRSNTSRLIQQFRQPFIAKDTDRLDGK